MENYVSERSLELQEMALIRIKQLQSEVDAMITEAGGAPGGQIKDFKLLSKEKLLEAAAKLQEVDDLFSDKLSNSSWSIKFSTVSCTLKLF